MARKKKKKVGAHKRRRHRVGAGGKMETAILKGVGVAVGAIITPFLVQGVQTAFGAATASAPEWLFPGGAAITGGAIATFGGKMPVVEGIGMGMLAVGAVMVANDMGLNEPGISGLAMSSNVPAGTAHISQSIGCGPRSGVGFVNQTVGGYRPRRAMSVGALVSL